MAVKDRKKAIFQSCREWVKACGAGCTESIFPLSSGAASAFLTILTWIKEVAGRDSYTAMPSEHVSRLEANRLLE